MRRWGAIAAVVIASGCLETGEGEEAPAPTPVPECSSDAACAPEGRVCVDDRCVDPPCSGPGTCATGRKCDSESSTCLPCVLRSCEADYEGLCGAGYPDGCDGTLHCETACGEGVACDPATLTCDCRPSLCSEQVACGSYDQGCGLDRLHCEHVCSGAGCAVEQRCGCEAGLDATPACPGAGASCGEGACPACRCAAGLVCSDAGRCEPFAASDCLSPVRRCGDVEGVDCGACPDGEGCVEPLGVCRPPDSPTCFQLAGRLEDPGQLGTNFTQPSEVRLGATSRLYFAAFTDPAPSTTLWSVEIDELGEPDWRTRRSETALDLPYDGDVSSPAAFSADAREVIVSLDKPLGSTHDAELFHAILAAPRTRSGDHLTARRITTLDTLAKPGWDTSVYAPTLLPDGRTLLYFSDYAEPNMPQPFGLYFVRRASRRADDAVFGESPADAPIRIIRDETVLNPSAARVRPAGMAADLRHVLLLTSPDGSPSRLVRAALSFDADGRPLLGPNEPIELRGAPEPMMLWSATMSPDGRRLWAMLQGSNPPFGVFRFVPCD